MRLLLLSLYLKILQLAYLCTPCLRFSVNLVPVVHGCKIVAVLLVCGVGAFSASVVEHRL